MEEKDKPVAMGFGLMLMSLFAFIPSPIIFGIILGEFKIKTMIFEVVVIVFYRFR